MHFINMINEDKLFRYSIEIFISYISISSIYIEFLSYFRVQPTFSHHFWYNSLAVGQNR